MKNKILIIANDYTTVYNFRSELVKRLIKEGYEVVVALPDDERNVKLAHMGCRVTELKMERFGKNPVKDIAIEKNIKKILDKEKPEVVLTYTAKPNIYGAMACNKKKVPCICNVTGLGSNFQSKNAVAAIMMMLQKKAYKKTETVFFQNKSNLDFFKKSGIVKGNAELLPGSGVNLSENCLEEYVDNDIPKFITVARIRKDKGYDELFDVIKRLKANGIKAEFHIVGWYEDESYKETVDELIKDYGVVFYEDMPHEKVHNLMAECDCLIHPSHHEGMSNVILEAAAIGRPCIVSDIPGCMEGVDDGITGYYSKVKDSNSLYEAVLKFMDMPYESRKEMALASRKKMEEEFDREFVIERYLNKIEKFIKKEGREYELV